MLIIGPEVCNHELLIEPLIGERYKRTRHFHEDPFFFITKQNNKHVKICTL